MLLSGDCTVSVKFYLLGVLQISFVFFDEIEIRKTGCLKIHIN